MVLEHGLKEEEMLKLEWPGTGTVRAAGWLDMA